MAPCDRLRRGALATALAGLTACSALEEKRLVGLLPEDVAPDRLVVCHGHGCGERTDVSLTGDDWQLIQDAFESVSDAEGERRAIAASIAHLERLVGIQAGTHADGPRDAFVIDFSTQLDCVDEAINTTTYLRVMQTAGLLRWHRVGLPAGRGVIIDLSPHNTATVIEIATGRAYAVDSWFLANGEPPFVLPLSVWRAGWDPEDGPPPKA